MSAYRDELNAAQDRIQALEKQNQKLEQDLVTIEQEQVRPAHEKIRQLEQELAQRPPKTPAPKPIATPPILPQKTLLETFSDPSHAIFLILGALFFLILIGIVLSP